MDYPAMICHLSVLDYTASTLVSFPVSQSLTETISYHLNTLHFKQPLGTQAEGQGWLEMEEMKATKLVTQDS